MDEGSETVPDLKDIEVKIGRKTPEGLLRWMREEASSHRGDVKLATAHDAGKETGKKSLDEKIRKLKMEMVRMLNAPVCTCVHVCLPPVCRVEEWRSFRLLLLMGIHHPEISAAS